MRPGRTRPVFLLFLAIWAWMILPGPPPPNYAPAAPKPFSGLTGPRPARAQAQANRLAFILDAPTKRRAEAELMAEQLARVGILAKVRVRDRGEMMKSVRKGRGVAYLTSWGSAFFDPYDLAVPKLGTGGRGNFSGYSNPRVDALLQQGSAAPSSAVREQSCHDVQRIILAQTPWAFGYVLDRFEGISRDVTGYDPALDGRINLHDAALSHGDTLVVALDENAFISFDPAMFRSRTNETLIRNIFDALVTRTPDGRVVPELALSWERNGPLEYVFTLRQGPRFHDGSPVTAKDVAFTFDRILNPFGVDGLPSPRLGLLGPLASVKALDDQRVKFALSRPFAAFLQALVHFQIVPRDHIIKVGEKAFAEHPVGAGPFRFVSGGLDSTVILKRFDDYYGGSPDLEPVGPARVEQAEFRLVPDAMQRIRALLSGAAHIAQNVPLAETPGLETANNVTILRIQGTRSHQLELDNTTTPFNDIRIRKAVAYAIDWDEILTKIYKKSGQRLATCFLPSGFGYDPDLAPMPHDPKAAAMLLKAMGFDTTPISRP